MAEHYLTEQHQASITKAIEQLKLQFLDTQMDTDLPRITTVGVIDSFTAHFQELYETVDILSGGIETLTDDGQRLNNESLQYQIKLQKLEQALSEVKLAMEEENSYLEGIKPNQNILNQDIATLKEKINDMQSVSYYGTFVWKITECKKKMSKYTDILIS